MSDYYEEFKPIRNKLSKINLFFILNFISRETKREQTRIVPEVINFLYSNALMFCPTLKNIREVHTEKDIIKIINEIEELDLKITGSTIEKFEWDWFVKLYENQSKYKRHSFQFQLFRYYFIYSSPKLSDLFLKKFGIDYVNFLRSSVLLYSVFEKLNWKIEKNELEALIRTHEEKSHTSLMNNIEVTLSILSSDIITTRNSLKEKMKYDENVFFQYSFSHLVNPIIKIDQFLCCPNSNLLLNQFTGGVYYLLNMHKLQGTSGNIYGQEYENYIGIILNKLLTDGYKLFHDEIYKRNGIEIRPPDWIIVEDESIVMIECKTKRKVINEKIFRNDTNDSYIQFAITTLFQLYQRINDFINNYYGFLDYDHTKTIIPIILFLEDDLYIDIDFRITNPLKELLKSEGIDEKIVEEFPAKYYSTSIFEFEVFLMFKYGFKKYFNMKSKNLISPDEDAGFSYNKIFSEEFEEIFVEPFKH